MVAAVVVASASAAGAGLPPPIMRGDGQALAASGSHIAAAATCDVRVADIGSKPKLLERYGYCREDRFDSAVIGLWLGKKTIVEDVLISPSPHGDTYQLWSGPLRGSLHQIGGDWGRTDSDEPPTYGCDRMVASGGGVVASAPVANDLGDGSACTGATSTKVTLAGAVNRTFTLAGAWGPIAANSKRVALVEFDSSGNRRTAGDGRHGWQAPGGAGRLGHRCQGRLRYIYVTIGRRDAQSTFGGGCSGHGGSRAGRTGW